MGSDKGGSFIQRVYLAWARGRIPRKAARQAKTLPDAYAYIHDQPRQSKPQNQEPSSSQRNPAKGENRPSLLKRVVDATSCFAHEFYKVLKGLKRKPGWVTLTNEEAQERVDHENAELVKPKIKQQLLDLAPYVSQHEYIWDSSPADGEMRPEIKRLATEKRLAAERAQVRKTGGVYKMIARPSLQDDQLVSHVSRHEADLRCSHKLFIAKDPDNTVWEIDESDGLILVCCRQVRWLIIHRRNKKFPYLVVDKSKLEGSAVLPFTDLTCIQVYGLLCHEYVDGGIPEFAWGRLGSDEYRHFVEQIASGFDTSKEAYDAACEQVEKEVIEFYKQKKVDQETIRIRQTVLTKTWKLLHDALSVLRTLQTKDEVQTFSKADLRRQSADSLPSSFPSYSEVPSPSDKRLKRCPRHVIQGITRPTGEYAPFSSLASNNPFALLAGSDPDPLDNDEDQDSSNGSSSKAQPTVPNSSAERPQGQRKKRERSKRSDSKSGKRKGRFKDISVADKAKIREAKQLCQFTSAAKLLKQGFPVPTSVTTSTGKGDELNLDLWWPPVENEEGLEDEGQRKKSKRVVKSAVMTEKQSKSRAKKPSSGKGKKRKKDPNNLDRAGQIYGFDVHGRKMDDIVRASRSDSPHPPEVATLLRLFSQKRRVECITVTHALKLLFEALYDSPGLSEHFLTSSNTKNVLGTMISALMTTFHHSYFDTQAPEEKPKHYDYAAEAWARTRSGQDGEDFATIWQAKATAAHHFVMNTSSKEIDWPTAQIVVETLRHFPALDPTGLSDWDIDISQMTTSLLTSNKETVLPTLAKRAADFVDALFDGICDVEEPHELEVLVEIVSRSQQRASFIETYLDVIVEEPVPKGALTKGATALSPNGQRYIKERVVSAIDQVAGVRSSSIKTQVIARLQTALLEKLDDELQTRNFMVGVLLQSDSSTTSEDAPPAPAASDSRKRKEDSAAAPDTVKRARTNASQSEPSAPTSAAISAASTSAATSTASTSAAKPTGSTSAATSTTSTPAANTMASTSAAASTSKAAPKRPASPNAEQQAAKRSKATAQNDEPDSTRRSSRLKANGKNKVDYAALAGGIEDDLDGEEYQDPAPIKKTTKRKSTAPRKSSASGTRVAKDKEPSTPDVSSATKDSAPEQNAAKEDDKERDYFKCGSFKREFHPYTADAPFDDSVPLADFIWYDDDPLKTDARPAHLLGWMNYLKRTIDPEGKGASIIYNPKSVGYDAESLLKLVVDPEVRLQQLRDWFIKGREKLRELLEGDLLPVESKPYVRTALDDIRSQPCFLKTGAEVDGIPNVDPAWLQDLTGHVERQLSILNIKPNDFLFEPASAQGQQKQRKRSREGQVLHSHAEAAIHGKVSWLYDVLLDLDKANVPPHAIPDGRIFVDNFTLQLRCLDVSKFHWPSTVPDPPGIDEVQSPLEMLELAIQYAETKRWISFEHTQIFENARKKDVRLSVVPSSQASGCRLQESNRNVERVPYGDVQPEQTSDGLPKFLFGCLSDNARNHIAEWLLGKPRKDFDESTFAEEFEAALQDAIKIGVDGGVVKPLTLTIHTFSADGKPVVTSLTVGWQQFHEIVASSQRRCAKDPNRSQDQEAAIRKREEESLIAKFCLEVVRVAGLNGPNVPPARDEHDPMDCADDIRYCDILSSKRRKVLFFIGNDAPTKGRQPGRHSAMISQRLIRKLIKACARYGIDAKFLRVGEAYTSQRCPCCEGQLKDVEYVSGGVCHRIKDCPLTKRRRHRDIAAGENMLLKGQWHLRTGRKDWK